MAFFKREKNGGKGMAGKLVKLSEKGRRRENVALFTVLLLLFLLTGAMVSWISIAKKTETEQRLDAYGEWKAAFLGVGKERMEAFVNHPKATRSGVSKLVGKIADPSAKEKIEEVKALWEGNPEGENLTVWEMLGYTTGAWEEKERAAYLGIYGVIGTLDGGCRELGRISMEEGRFPETAEEIAMTRSMLTRLGTGEEIGQRIDFVVISEDGEVLEQRYRLCGILEAYGGNWQTKGYPLVSAVISEEAAEGFSWEPVYNAFADVDGTVESVRRIYNMSEEPMDVIQRFAFNSYAYDFWGRTDNTYIWFMFLIVIMTAVVTIFQITSVQIRKRSRQVGLLKAIGATNAQVRRIFLREITGVLWRAALPGTVLGTVLVPAVLWGSGLAGKRRLYYGLNPVLLIGAVCICCVTTWTGALIPVRRGGKIPIRGEISAKTAKRRPIKAGKKYSVGKLTAGGGGNSFRAAMVLLLGAMSVAVFLASWQAEKALAPYRNGKKALYYRLSLNGEELRYGGGAPDRSVLAQISLIPGVDGVYTRKNGVYCDYDDFYISYEGVEDCELERLRKQWNAPPYSYMTDIPSVKKEDRAMVSLMGIDTGWEKNLEGLAGLVTEGEFNREAFEAGEEVLLFLPPYRETDYRAVGEEVSKLDVNTDRRYRNFYEEDTCIKPGDTITLIANWRVIDDGASVNEERKLNPELLYEGTREIQVKVGGIIRYLPQDTKNPLWNIWYPGNHSWTNDVLNPGTVIADGGLVNEIRILHQELAKEYRMEEFEKEGIPYGEDMGMDSLPIYGYSAPGRGGIDISFNEIEILCDSSVSESTEGGIKSLAETYRMGIATGDDGREINYETWKTEYREAFHQAIVWLMAGAAAVFVFVCLLLQNAEERLASDRRRMGIFQSMGVGSGEIARSYFWKGLGNGLLALALAHGVLLGAALWQNREVVSKLSPYRFVNGREAFLYRFHLWFGSYDWKWHILACALVLIFAAALYLMPLREVLKSSPVENIRELGE